MNHIAISGFANTILYCIFVEEFLKGKNIDFGLTGLLSSSRMSLFRKLEIEGFIITTESDKDKIRIIPLGINHIATENEKNEVIFVCINMAEHHTEFELDENLIEE